MCLFPDCLGRICRRNVASAHRLAPLLFSPSSSALSRCHPLITANGFSGLAEPAFTVVAPPKA